MIEPAEVVQKPHDWGLFKNVQMQGAQKAEPRGVFFIRRAVRFAAQRRR